ncbi:MAG: hypothetical protein AAB834_00280, partial [Patescibacteria group bacterium]
MTTRRQHAQRAQHTSNRETGVRPWHVGLSAGVAAGIIILASCSETSGSAGPENSIDAPTSTATAPQYPGTPSASPSEIPTSATPTPTESIPPITTLAPTPKKIDPNEATRRLIARRNGSCTVLGFTAANGINLNPEISATPDSASLAARASHNRNGPITWGNQRVIAVHLGPTGMPDGKYIVATGDAGDTNRIDNVNLTLPPPGGAPDAWAIGVNNSAKSRFDGRVIRSEQL